MRERAIDETKVGGDPTRALALALIYVGDQIGDSGGCIGQALEDLAQTAELARGNYCATE